MELLNFTQQIMINCRGMCIHLVVISQKQVSSGLKFDSDNFQ